MSAQGLPEPPQFFRGEWLAPGDSGYDERRAHFNTRFDRRPALIARCRGVQDVRAALRVAQEQGWEVAVRGGGRGFGGHSTIEGGLLLDLSLMNEVFVDAERRTARVGPGATQGEVLIETVPYGLAPITGVASHLGFVGVTIYSGAGYLSGRHGYGCDWVLSAQVVLASGEVVTASAHANPDLYWAIRGAGDNFGVVVSMEVQLHPVPERTTAARWSWPADQAAELMRRHRELDRGISEDVFMFSDLAVNYAADELRYELALVHLGDDQAVAADIATVDAFGVEPKERTVDVVDWVTLHHSVDEMWPSARHYWAGAELVELNDAALDRVLSEAKRMAADADGVPLMIGYYRYHHAMLRHNAAPAAAMNRRHGCDLVAIAVYDDPARDESCEAWAEGFVQRFRDAGLVYPGAIVNYTTRPDMRESWGVDYDRLAVLKAKYDPGNVFRHNNNIPPAEAKH